MIPDYQCAVAINRDGFTESGLDSEGYDVDGFSKRTKLRKSNLNRGGFHRTGIHSVTKTAFDPDGYNTFGLNAEGRNRAGELNQAVAFAIAFLAQPKTEADYALANNLTLEELDQRLQEALQYMPSLKKDLNQHTKTSAAQALAEIASAIRAQTAQDASPEAVWQRYPNADVRALIKELSPQEIYAFFGPSFRQLDPKGSETIHQLAKICHTRLPSEIVYLIHQLKIHLRKPGFTQETVDLANHLALIERFAKAHLDTQLCDLYTGFKVGTMSGDFVIMHEFTPDDVKAAVARLEARGGVLSTKGVYNEVIKYR